MHEVAHLLALPVPHRSSDPGVELTAVGAREIREV